MTLTSESGTLRLSPVVEATPEGLPEIIALLDRVFPGTRQWGPNLEWQYLRNPRGPARYVNAFTESDGLVAHYAVIPTPPLAEPPGNFTGTYFALNTAVHPAARIPGLMIATARALFRRLQAEGPTVVLGVANENSVKAYGPMLGFRPLGRLRLTFHPPGGLPAAAVPRALACDKTDLAWRTARPGAAAYADPRAGALTVRLRHHGIPIDAVLSIGLPRDAVESLALPRAGRWVPRLYAGFGNPSQGGVPVPDRLRPSPLEYIVRVLGDKALTEPVVEYLAGRRFEFLDFDVV